MERKRTESVEGRYANYLEIGRSAEEIVMDFGQVFDAGPTLIHTRIVTHPAFAQEMVELLRHSLERIDEQNALKTSRPASDSNR